MRVRCANCGEVRETSTMKSCKCGSNADDALVPVEPSSGRGESSGASRGSSSKMLYDDMPSGRNSLNG